jgi:hypothetical protein
MTEKKSTSARKRRPPTEIRITPESEKWLKERLASPEGQKLLDELAMVFVYLSFIRINTGVTARIDHGPPPIR